MPDKNDTRGYEPAPWEEPGKRHTDSVPKPPPQQPRPPQPPQQQPPAPYLGDQPQQPSFEPAPSPTYHQPPLAPGLQNPPQQAPSQGGPAPQQYPPSPAPPGAPSPYGYNTAAFVPHKPNSTFALISLILIGPGLLMTFLFFFIGPPIFIAGIVLGALGLRETGRLGTKAGRGMALAGTITNSALLLITVGLFLALVVFVTTAISEVEQGAKVQQDSQLIIERVGMYHRAKGDLSPGGPQMVRGLQSSVAVEGSLKVSDLVSRVELEMEIDQYRLDVDESAGRATLYYTDDKNATRDVGSYPRGFDSFQFDFD